MRLAPETLTFRALVALDEVMDRGPATQGLRFALAYLYAVGEADRHWFDEFWRAARTPIVNNAAEDFGRQQRLTGAMNAICRSVGMERDVDMMTALRKARGVDTIPPYPKRPIKEWEAERASMRGSD